MFTNAMLTDVDRCSEVFVNIEAIAPPCYHSSAQCNFIAMILTDGADDDIPAAYIIYWLPHFVCQDVRKASRLVTRLEELSACLETKKTTASQELDEQVTG